MHNDQHIKLLALMILFAICGITSQVLVETLTQSLLTQILHVLAFVFGGVTVIIGVYYLYRYITSKKDDLSV